MRVAFKKPSNDTQEAKTRVQLDLAPSQMERLNWLMDTCGIETRKDLFNNAISLLEWAVLEVMNGRVVVSVDKEAKHMKELTMPALADAARYGAAVRARSTGIAAERA